ncbi:hypothetical protein PYW07_013465 [Mythimna separata]|uniref:Pre-C2HC domain-containing protein n=1 Tax=Mythimna separata TaxID=271217 RepID=A0AAD8DKG8_MYTSE|nr:hypothetical protein PYW07_013465 [Mythimna separata]
MSAYSGNSDLESRDVSYDTLRDLGLLDVEHPSTSPDFQPDARPQRRPRSSDGDAAEEAKHYCLDREVGSPTFADTVRSPPPPRAATSQHDRTPPAGTTPAPPQKKPSRYPPLVVERLPNWVAHFKALKELLGRPPNARPYQGGIRFLPESEGEYRVLQRYLTDQEKECGLSWFAYSPPTERSLKVAIRGLPKDTEPAEIEEELRRLGYQPEYVRNIKARGGRPGCIFHAALKRNQGVFKVYDTTQFLLMRGVKVEAWRGRRGPVQCHQFRHSSHRCHRPLVCVRCGESHAARDCPPPPPK